MNNLCQEFRSSEVQEFRHYSFILEFWSSGVQTLLLYSGVQTIRVLAFEALWLLSFRSSLLTALAMGY